MWGFGLLCENGQMSTLCRAESDWQRNVWQWNTERVGIYSLAKHSFAIISARLVISLQFKNKILPNEPICLRKPRRANRKISSQTDVLGKIGRRSYATNLK